MLYGSYIYIYEKDQAQYALCDWCAFNCFKGLFTLSVQCAEGEPKVIKTI